MSTSTVSSLALLRERTAEAHRNLEDQIDILSACKEPASYRRLLQGFYGFYRPLEERLAATGGWSAIHFDWVDRAKTPRLERDLLALGLSAADVEALPRCGHLPEVKTFSEGLGVAYVLEGATLGGRQICGILATSEISPDARAFFTSYGEKVGERWKEFCGVLTKALEDEKEAEEAAGAASATFASLSVWLKGNM